MIDRLAAWVDRFIAHCAQHPMAVIGGIECGIVFMSCFLMLNSLPRKNTTVEKCAIALIGFGALGVALGPLDGVDLYPSIFDLVFRFGAAVFSIILTSSLWHELPFVNRRHRCMPGEIRHVPALRRTSDCERVAE